MTQNRVSVGWWRHSALRVLGAIVMATIVGTLSVSAATADGPDDLAPSDKTSEKKLAEVASHEGGLAAPEAAADFYLDDLTQVAYGGSHSDVYLSSGWDTSCGFFACGRTITYEYTRTVWYGSTPYNAYSMQLNNKWVQSGFGATSASCSIGYPLAVSCTISGTGSKTATKTGPVWNNLWSVYNEFFSGVVDFDDFTLLGSLQETATSTICYYAGQCQTFQAQDTGP